MFHIAIFRENGKVRMKCVKKNMMRAPKGASRKFLDMRIDPRNNLSKMNFLKISLTFHKFPWLQQISEFPWLNLKFSDFSLKLNFPDFSLTSGNPVTMCYTNSNKQSIRA